MNIPIEVLESPKAQAALQDSINIKLEQNIAKSPKKRSIFSPCSSPQNCKTEKKSCGHYKLVSDKDYNTCFHCGVYVPKNGVKAFKFSKMNYQPFFSAKSIYEAMTKRSYQFTQALNSEYSKTRHNHIESIFDLAKRFKISANSSHLAVFLLDLIMYRDVSLTPKLELFAPTCLLVAAKTIELDSRVPYLPKFSKYADTDFDADDFRKAELQVLDLLDWNPQFSSAFEITEFFLSQGVIFSTDEIKENINSQDSSGILREKAQSENKNNENTPRGKKKGFTKSSDRENNENSESEHSTNGTNIDDTGTPSNGAIIDTQQAEERSSPLRLIPILINHSSTLQNAENPSSGPEQTKSVESKVGDILSHIETNYKKLFNLLVKDVEFVEWEPRIISTAAITFLRYVNNVTPVWSPELEIIAQLKLPQIFSCFELMSRKYTYKFATFIPPFPRMLHTSNSNRDILSELKLLKSNSFSDKNTYSTPKPELPNRTNLAKSNNHKSLGLGNLVEHNNNIILSDHKSVERKPIFSSLPKNTISAPFVSSTAYNYPIEDLQPKIKCTNGVVNPEPSLKSLTKNSIFPPKFQHSRHNSNYDNLKAYQSNVNSTQSGSTTMDVTRGNNLVNQNNFASENYIVHDLQRYKNPPNLVLTTRAVSSIETGNHQAKLVTYRK